MSGWTAILAPLPEEIRALRRILAAGEDDRDLRRALEDLPWVATGRVAGVRALLAVTGDGAANARSGVEAVLEAASPERLLVVGVGGGLSPVLEVEDVVVVREARSPEGGVLLADEDAVERTVDKIGVESAVAVTCRRLVLSAQAKKDLYAEQGEPDRAVVDLESWFYARAAAQANVPWTVLRAVSDDASEDLPAFLDDCLDEGGGVDRSKVARHALFHPTVTPRLLDMKRRVEACSKRLAEHVEELLEAGR